MEPRAIRDLAQLGDDDLFSSVAEGLELIMKNVNRLYDGAECLAGGKQFHVAHVITRAAEEEAAKFLILVDAIRCPRQPADIFARQLQRFNSHLAKGLYARAYNYRVSTGQELQGYIDLDRPEYYLDGPNGVDWIFRNDIVSGREAALYVDYERHDTGNLWTDPSRFEDMMFGLAEPEAVSVARSLHGVGFASASALATVAEVWRSKKIGGSTRWHDLFDMNVETLATLNQRDQAAEQPDKVYQHIYNRWQFPLYNLDLSPIPVDRDSLRAARESWAPEGSY